MMKNVSLTSTLVRVSSACILSVCMATAAVAADTKPAAAPAAAPAASMGKIAVVDLQMLVVQSKAGKSIRDQLDKQRNDYRSQIEKQEAELSATQKDLMAQRDKLPKDELAKKGKDFQNKVVAAQRDVQKRRAAFEKAYTTAMESLRERIVKIVADLAGKNGISLVLNRQDVVLVDAKMDISKQVLSALDAQVTSIPVKVE